MRLHDVLDLAVLQKLADANCKSIGMPIGIIDAFDSSVLVGCGWQEICTEFHRVHPVTAERCRQSDDFIKQHLRGSDPCEYKCKNGLWDIGIPIRLRGQHLATLFLGQFFYEGESPDRDFFRDQGRAFGFDERAYLAALDRVPVFSRAAVDNMLAYNGALASFISELAEENLLRKEAAEEAERRARELERAEQALLETDRRKTQFLAVLSHELRNPLAPIRNSLYLLRRAPLEAEHAARALDIIERQTLHLTRLVDDLLDATRISHGKIELKREPLDLRGLVRRACDDHRAIFDQRGVSLRFDEPGPLWVDADVTRIAQAVGNLLQNSAKFTPRGGHAWVSLAAEGGRAVIRVRDDGAGMEPANIGRMFEPFAQADSSLAHPHGGLGLGLALVKRLTEMHGGSVEGRSEGLGCGSEFTIALPLCGHPAPRASGSVAAGQRVTRDVLIIEDSVDAGESLADALRVMGHHVHVALDGRSGIAEARRLAPDAVLCDVGLPDVDGYEVARMLRADLALRSTRLVALTGYAQPDDCERAREAGFDAHLAKPASMEEIENAIVPP